MGEPDNFIGGNSEYLMWEFVRVPRPICHGSTIGIMHFQVHLLVPYNSVPRNPGHLGDRIGLLDG